MVALTTWREVGGGGGALGKGSEAMMPGVDNTT